MESIAEALLKGPFKGYFDNVTGTLQRAPTWLKHDQLQANLKVLISKIPRPPKRKANEVETVQHLKVDPYDGQFSPTIRKQKRNS